MAYKQIRVIGSDSPADKLLNDVFVSHLRPSYVEIGEDNFCMPIAYKNVAEKIKEFRVRDDDIYLVAFPRTGTTWSQEMIWLIVNDLDFEGAKAILGSRFPFFDLQAIFGENKMFEERLGNTDYFQLIAERESPRCIKSHLQFQLLPEDITSGKKRPKMISVLRNPKDTCVSLYHQSRLMEGYRGNFDEFCELFLAGRVPNAPFWKNVLSFWNRRHELDILFIRYKEMKEDLPGVIGKVADFFGKSYTGEEIKALETHLSFENMKTNRAVNNDIILEHWKPMNMTVSTENTFIRAGKQGGYTAFMSEEMIRRFDEWTEENLKGSDLIIE